MEIKGIDISSYQGKPDWGKVAQSGIKFALLRIHQLYGIDTSFEYNYKNAEANNIKVGGYKYSYAKNVAQAETEADTVLAVLNGRKLDLPIYYDLEWDEQYALGKSTVQKIANAFCEKIKAAGYIPAIYCNVNWYKNICGGLNYPYWIANYPSAYNTTKESLRPNLGEEIWQYGRYNLSGVSGYVDMDTAIDSYISKYAGDSKEKSPVISAASIDGAIALVCSIALAEEGYEEKNNGNNLDDKHAGAGSGNWTKYWRDTKPSYQGLAWCADFVTWCFEKAFGKTMASKLLKHYPYVYCPTLANYTNNYGPAESGDAIIFYNGKEYYHTGIVVKVDATYIYTIEGNTSPGDGKIVDNGGGVYQKKYRRGTLHSKTKFFRPDYSIVNISQKQESNQTNGGRYMFICETVKAGSVGLSVLLLQEILRARGIKGADGKALKLDREAGENTIYALTQYQKSRSGVLEVDGVCGAATWSDLIAL